MEGNEELDRRIDSALVGYSDAEPLAGLEERVLRRVRLATRRRMLGWAVAASVVVTVIVVRVPHHVGPTYRVGVPAVMRPAPVVEKPRVVAVRRAKSRAVRARRLPKLEQFPAPTPLTGAERALRAFVEQHPAEAQQVFAELQKSNEPIEIQPIQIPPLQSDGAQ
jgi:hypothetical protein